jgi:hypothetical protein
VKLKWLPALMALCVLSCKKDYTLKGITLTQPHGPVTDSIAVNVSIDDSKPGYTVSSQFEGLSYETAILGQNPEYLNSQNKVLINLMQNLGNGVLRIGGNSSDLTDWEANITDTAQKNAITPAQIDRLADFSKATGWQVIFGLNLVNRSATAAAQEAAYVYKKLGHNLLSLQNGNEPDVYFLGPRPRSYSYSNYCAEWYRYFKAIRKSVPQANFAGPDVTPFNDTWLKNFAIQEAANIDMIDGHYYVTGPASKPSIVYGDILNDNKNIYEYLSTLHSVATTTNKPFRISECNSVFGQGKPGVSNVFASALWALDFMWKVADKGGQGVNFHGGNTHFIYSPIAHFGNDYTAQPEYYAMLAFKYGAVGQTIIPAVMNRHDYSLGAHAVISANRKTYSVTLINKEIKTDAIFTLRFTKPVDNVSVARLTSPTITSGDNVTFAGSQVNADGTFTPDITEKYQLINSYTVTIRIPAASAAVVSVN